MRAALLSLLFVLGTVHAVPTSHSSTPTLLFTNAPPSGCLAESYYGTYGSRADQHIYIPTASCLDQPDLLSKASWGGMGPLFPLKDSRLVWVGQAGVENAPNDLMEDWMMIKRAVLQRSTRPDDSTHQRVFDGVSIDRLRGTDEIRIVHASDGSIIMQISERLLPVIDTFLPPHLVPVIIPREPYPVENGLTGWNPVPKRYADHLANITSHLKFDPKLDSVLTQISHDELRRNIRYLTGEAPSGITSRHSFTPGAIKAAHWLQEQAEKTGAECHLEHFLPGFSPNVICTYPSKTNSTDKVILSAHYDSRGSWGSVIAPGGDDDGSGSGHLLSIAQTIGRSGVSFDQTVVLAFFAGEEQGLLGSHAYAEKLYKNNETVLYHVQADMLAYHVPGEPLQLGLPQSIHLAEASYLLGNLSHIYAPELLVGKTAACCSDHQSFLSFGFPASAVFERNGPIADPKYHNSGDVSSREGYDFEQVVSIAKVTLAAILTVGGWSRE